MRQFFYLHGFNDGSLSVARHAPDQDFIFLPNEELIKSWTKPELQLDGNRPGDDLTHTLGCGSIVSRHLRDVLDTFRRPGDGIQWLDVSVRWPNGHIEDFYILHFFKTFDVLNPKDTVSNEQGVIRPSLDPLKAVNHLLFGIPTRSSYTICVAEEVKDAVERAKCTGVEFSKVRMLPALPPSNPV